MKTWKLLVGNKFILSFLGIFVGYILRTADYIKNMLEGRGRWITKSRNRDHPGQHGETPSLLKKNTKN